MSKNHKKPRVTTHSIGKIPQFAQKMKKKKEGKEQEGKKEKKEKKKGVKEGKQKQQDRAIRASIPKMSRALTIASASAIALGKVQTSGKELARASESALTTAITEKKDLLSACPPLVMAKNDMYAPQPQTSQAKEAEQKKTVKSPQKSQAPPHLIISNEKDRTAKADKDDKADESTVKKESIVDKSSQAVQAVTVQAVMPTMKAPILENLSVNGNGLEDAAVARSHSHSLLSPSAPVDL